RQRLEENNTDEETGAEEPVIQLNEIDDLCSCLSKVNHYNPDLIRRHEEECIGYLPDTSEGTQYIFYSLEWPLPGPEASNNSLFDMLRSQTGSETFKVPARLELAFILSISLLQHQSSPWIKKKFHSWDFGLYPALSGSSSALRWLPHI